MNENEAISFTRKHENLLLKNSSDIKELKSDVSELKGDVKELNGRMHRFGVTQEDMVEKLNRVLEVVMYNNDNYEREMPPVKETLVHHDNRISALESIASRIKN